MLFLFIKGVDKCEIDEVLSLSILLFWFFDGIIDNINVFCIFWLKKNLKIIKEIGKLYVYEYLFIIVLYWFFLF